MERQNKTVVLLEDAVNIIKSYRKKIPALGFDLFVAANEDQILGFVKEGGSYIFLLNINLLGRNASFISRISMNKESILLLIADPGQNNAVINTIKKGAMDFIVRPFPFSELKDLIFKSIERKKTFQNVGQVELIKDSQVNDLVIGNSKAMKKVAAFIDSSSKSSEAILIIGERGTGKDTLGRMIHKLSSRSNQPFISVSMTLNKSKDKFAREVESLESGKITPFWRRLNAGTLHIDEISFMDEELQRKLSRILSRKNYSFRVIASVTKDLQVSFRSKRILDALYSFFTGFEIQLPPLRQRKEDIPDLVSSFLSRYRNIKLNFSDNAMNKMTDYHWPGNIIELKDFIHSLSIVHRGEKIRSSYVIKQLRLKQESNFINQDLNERLYSLLCLSMDTLPKEVLENKFHPLTEQFEAALIKYALHRCEDNQSKAARLLGISRNTLNKKFREL